MKRFLALAIAIVMCAGCLTACNGGKGANDNIDPEELINRAENTLASAEVDFKMTMSVEISSDNEDMNEFFDALLALQGDEEIIFNGENRKGYITEISEDGIINNIGSSYCVDGWAYCDTTAQKIKCEVTDAQRDVLFGTASTPVKYDVFDNATVTKKKGAYIVEFSRLSADGIEELEDAFVETGMGDLLELFDTNFGEASLVCVVKGDRLESITLNFPFSVTEQGKTYNITMKQVMLFDYDNVPEITAPDGDFRTVSYNELKHILMG